ncbi:unnamed protein product [Lactuca saligna]|uniref:Uncharacterized protein n=1 Tax=Lactuca saligna TaxID=75948 RepID=A0AA35Y5M6_LACSI|nr:unnamed protein product [Lactuca saligna]
MPPSPAATLPHCLSDQPSHRQTMVSAEPFLVAAPAADEGNNRGPSIRERETRSSKARLLSSVVVKINEIAISFSSGATTVDEVRLLPCGWRNSRRFLLSSVNGGMVQGSCVLWVCCGGSSVEKGRAELPGQPTMVSVIAIPPLLSSCLCFYRRQPSPGGWLDPLASKKACGCSFCCSVCYVCNLFVWKT